MFKKSRTIEQESQQTEEKSTMSKAEETATDADKAAKAEEQKPRADKAAKAEEQKPQSDKAATAEEQKPRADRAAKAEEQKPQSDKAARVEEINPQEGKATEKNRKKKKHVVAWMAGVIVALLLITYGGVAIYFQTHFFPNTSVNGMDCSYMEAGELAQLLTNQSAGYELTVLGRDIGDVDSQTILGTIEAGSIALMPQDSLNVVRHLLEQQNNLFWIEILSNTHYYNTVSMGVSYDEDKLRAEIESWDAFQKKNMIVAEDAYIGEYAEDTKSYAIVEEKKGTQLDISEAMEQIRRAVSLMETEVDLDALGCYYSAAVTSQDEKLQDMLKQVNTWVSTEITYDWNGSSVVLDGDLIREWISMEDGEAALDEEAVADFVSENAKANDTYGRPRKFVTYMQVELTLPSGAYGWRTDRGGETEELLQLIYQGSVQEREPLYINRAANKGKNDIGSSYVEADLTNQHLYLFVEGELILEADFVSGTMSTIERLTPPGVFGLTYKTTNAVLRGEDYETPVNYWMPFNGDIGMHDATWRRAFGGDIYLNNGSHGCLNLPLSKAREIYEYVSTGFPVICYYY